MHTTCVSSVAKLTLEARLAVISRLEEETHSTLRNWSVEAAAMLVRSVKIIFF